MQIAIKYDLAILPVFNLKTFGHNMFISSKTHLLVEQCWGQLKRNKKKLSRNEVFAIFLRFYRVFRKHPAGKNIAFIITQYLTVPSYYHAFQAAMFIFNENHRGLSRTIMKTASFRRILHPQLLGITDHDRRYITPDDSLLYLAPQNRPLGKFVSKHDSYRQIKALTSIDQPIVWWRLQNRITPSVKLLVITDIRARVKHVLSTFPKGFVLGFDILGYSNIFVLPETFHERYAELYGHTLLSCDTCPGRVSYLRYMDTHMPFKLGDKR